MSGLIVLAWSVSVQGAPHPACTAETSNLVQSWGGLLQQARDGLVPAGNEGLEHVHQLVRASYTLSSVADYVAYTLYCGSAKDEAVYWASVALDASQRLLESAQAGNGLIPGWPLGIPFDAFGDGSTNPGDTRYTYLTGRVLSSIYDVLHAVTLSPAVAESTHRLYRIVKEQADAMLDAWDAVYVDEDEGGSYRYSTSASDDIFVLSTNTIMGYVWLARYRLDGQWSSLLRARSLARSIGRRMKSDPVHPPALVWSYSESGAVVEDSPHAAYDIQFLVTSIGMLEPGAAQDSAILATVERMTREVDLDHTYSLQGHRYQEDPRAVRGLLIPLGYAALLPGGGELHQRLGAALRTVLAQADVGNLSAKQKPVVAKALGLYLGARHGGITSEAR